MARRVTTHNGRTFDGEALEIVIIWEENFSKEQVKKENRFTKSHEILIKNGPVYEFLRKEA